MRISLESTVRAGAVLGLLLAGAVPLWAETVAATATAAASDTVAAPPATAAPATEAPADAGAEVVTDGPVPEALLKDGETLFLRNCRRCHGTRGTAGVPLKENADLADASYVAAVILVGPGYMASFAEALDDAQIAAIATYVRNNWGNAYGAVTPQDVADMR